MKNKSYCSICKKWLPLTSFHKCRSQSNGLQNFCSPCGTAIRKARKLLMPWIMSYNKARRRCLEPKNNRYYRYGGRGIEFKMTLNDFKILWFRDKAYLMEHPTIDRMDNDGHYETGNCRFLEKCKNKRGGVK